MRTVGVSAETAGRVIARDRGRCIWCGAPYQHLAHVHSRGLAPDLADEVRNICCLCRHCHSHRQHTAGTISSRELIARLAELYGSDYPIVELPRKGH